MRLHDTWLGGLVMALAALVYAYTYTFPPMPGQVHGPALFPRLILAGMFACGAVIWWGGRGRPGPAVLIDDQLRGRRGGTFLFVLGSVVGYLLLADRLGFAPTATLMVGGLSWWLGVRPLRALLLGVAAAGLMQWFFGSLMRVPLPRGLFMQLVQGG